MKNVNVEKSDYSNQIPKILLERIIRSTTDIGDLVADPFSGTFSTCKAALSLGRLGGDAISMTRPRTTGHQMICSIQIMKNKSTVSIFHMNLTTHVLE